MEDIHRGTVRRQSKRVANAVGKKNAEKEEKSRRRGEHSSVIVDFTRLEMASLKRYRRHFNLNVRPNATKLELIRQVTKHFATKPKIREAEVISQFLYANLKQANPQDIK